MQKTRHWVCDCKQGFIYPMTQRHCLKCGAISTKEKSQTNNKKIQPLNMQWYSLFKEDMSMQKIADMYGVSVNKVRSNLKKAE